MSKVPPPDAILRSLGDLSQPNTCWSAARSVCSTRSTAADGRASRTWPRRPWSRVRTLRILVDALVVTGWVERQGDEYRNGEVAATYLGGGDGPDLRPVLRLWDRVVYPQWAGIEESLTTGDATFGFEDFSPEQHRDFTLGVATLTGRSAHALATTYDFGPHRAVLDLGGGTGSFLQAILKAHPHLRATLVERPATAEIARRTLAVEPRVVEVVEADFVEDPIPNGHDAVLLANVIHLFSPQSNSALLARIRASVEPGARLLLVDFWTDDAHLEPAFAALMAGEFLIVSGEGDVYSVNEVAGWLRATGWEFTAHKPLAGAASLVVATAVGTR